MVPLGAEILTERAEGEDRGAVRRTLSLGVRTHSAGEVAVALILNISETGLLLETIVKLAVGETLTVDIPEASSSALRVVWTDGYLAGCEFVSPLSTGAVSAAQLKAPNGTQTRYRARAATDRPERTADYHRDETSFERTIVMISALISVVALIIFLAAIVLL